jgi:hypothetical protein
MSLKLRPTGLGAGVDKDSPGRHRLQRSVDIGRIYQTRGGPELVLVQTINGPMTRSDRVATLEEAKAQFQMSWDEWKTWANLEEVSRARTHLWRPAKWRRNPHMPVQRGQELPPDGRVQAISPDEQFAMHSLIVIEDRRDGRPVLLDVLQRFTAVVPRCGKGGAQ